MLVMSRRQGETILIGDQIEIVIAHIGRSRVKVGIRAPRETTIVAREVKLVRDENLAAAAAGCSVGEISRFFQNIRTAPSVPTVPVDETVNGPRTP
jgi:carbon storage regulator